jgi:hypothetical protein
MTDIRTQDTASTVLLTRTGASPARHDHGWSACLDNLAERVLRG